MRNSTLSKTQIFFEGVKLAVCMPINIGNKRPNYSKIFQQDDEKALQQDVQAVADDMRSVLKKALPAR